MTFDSASRRDRAHEPAEQARAAARAAKRCITPGCGRPATGQRCTDCTRRIESNTQRYRGQGRRGPALKVASDAVDLRHAVEAAGKAMGAFAELAAARARVDRRVLEALAEPIAQIMLAERLLRGVRKRHRRAEEAARAPQVAPRRPQLAFPFTRWPDYMGAR